jgi:hypothetical protein
MSTSSASFVLSTNPLVFRFQTQSVRKAERCAYNSLFNSPSKLVMFAFLTFRNNNGKLNDWETTKENAVLSLVIQSVRCQILTISFMRILQIAIAARL